mgnify:CR=1 FL=1
MPPYPLIRIMPKSEIEHFSNTTQYKYMYFLIITCYISVILRLK